MIEVMQDEVVSYKTHPQCYGDDGLPYCVVYLNPRYRDTSLSYREDYTRMLQLPALERKNMFVRLKAPTFVSGKPNEVV